MKTLKNTKLLDAIAAAIQHEKDKFDFYIEASEDIENTSLSEFFDQLAEDVEDHVGIIENFYKKVEGVGEFPNLKQLSPIHKFHTSTISKLMKRLDRNMSHVPKDDLEVMEAILREEEDAKNFYSKIRNKFKDPNIKLLFQKLSHFSDENRTLIESQLMFLKEQTEEDENYYWNDDELMQEATKKSPRTSKKKAAGKKKASKKRK
ncbi:MAG: ferritin family protein [Spirochaetota bacterium]